MHSLCRSAPFNWNLFLGKRLTYAVRLLPTKILRQMNDQQASGSAWPEPPYLYKRYTAENWEKLQEARKTGVYPTTPLSQPPFPDYTIQSLEPPAPPTDAYTVFDQRWQVIEQLQTLEDLGVKQLFPSGPIDRIKELKKLNRTLIVQFLDLLDVLVKDPEQYGQRIENISTIFINMHHILNEYRPHQARETLRLLMENQLEKKKEKTAEIRRKCAETLTMLQTFGHEITQPLQNEESKMVVEMALDKNADEDTLMMDASKEETEHDLHERIIAAVDAIQ